MNQELKLYPIESAVMRVTASYVVPAVYNVEVTGETGSLDPTIKLVNTGKVVDGYLEVAVLGKDGIAIGSSKYSKRIKIPQMKDTRGVIVKGSNKEVKLEWKESNQLNQTSTAGLFHLSLKSESDLMGAPILHLKLGIDSVNGTVSGLATVTQDLDSSIVCTSVLTGTIISYETSIITGANVTNITLSGYPEIHWPAKGGIGPIIPKNFSASIVFENDWMTGAVEYQYQSFGRWVKETQKISIS
jgi:hypothetical protein